MTKRFALGLNLSLILGLSACGLLANSAAATSIPATIYAAATVKPTATAAPVKATASPTVIKATPQPTAKASLKSALQKFVEGLDKPTYLTYSPDGTGLLYVTEQTGRIRVIQNGALVKSAFLDLTDRVGSGGNEQGLLSVAFAPDFAQSRKLYVNYTDTNGDTVVSGFMSAGDGLSADPNSEWEIIKIDQPYANHNGGQLKFGPDGMLYIGMGDGGSQGDPENRAQSRNELLGKILRLDVSQSNANVPYTVPDNKASSGKPEIWALGFRNPWRFSFDRATGDLFIADVGQDTIEEVDMLPANTTGGANFGWKILEGTNKYSSGSTDGLVAPIWEYKHGNDGCSVTGGYVYRGTAVPALSGAYVYGDYCTGRTWTLRRNTAGKWTNEKLLDTGYSITSFGEDAQGELYVLNRDGAIYKIVGK